MSINYFPDDTLYEPYRLFVEEIHYICKLALGTLRCVITAEQFKMYASCSVGDAENIFFCQHSSLALFAGTVLFFAVIFLNSPIIATCSSYLE